MVGFVVGNFCVSFGKVWLCCVNLQKIDLFKKHLQPSLVALQRVMSSIYTRTSFCTKPQGTTSKLAFAVAVVAVCLETAGDDTYLSRLEFCEIVFNNDIIL